ncbi:SDR family NAD(P)-dependent oxidoreductase [Streptomyces sp. SPB074]|uniref:SDR family NAD(P)-dependent oxidoreductase n=1 Tax=Streptomyces sp. (strain SPB074) TaxID=465543 RepID=UPI000561063E|nr:SDR family NAD(P)-dependent oxidoreductase [Streptomyces sp. SPB074]
MTSTITLISGAARGLGLETARRLSALGHTVLVGARDPERGRAVAEEVRGRWVALDVGDADSVTAAARDVAAHEGRVDVLINNAGITGPLKSAADLTGEDALGVFQVNVLGIVRMTHAFLPLLREAADPRVVNVTSGLGSQTLTHDPERVEHSVVSPLYTSSKAAVKMLTTQYARGVEGVRFNAADPGYTATDLNRHTGTQTVTEGSDAIVALATEEAVAGTGRAVDRHVPLPW